MPLDSLSINGEPYRVVDQSRIGTRRRSYTETMRPSQPFETTPQVYSWAPWGPLGNSRQRLGGALSTDYTIDLDGRNFALLTSAAKRNAVDLTDINGLEYELPDATIDTTNWAEGAGNGDGNAHDELDDGNLFVPGTTSADFADADNEATYWTTSTDGAELLIGFADPTGTITTELGKAHRIAVSWQSPDATDILWQITFYDTTTIIGQTGQINLASTNWAGTVAGINAAIMDGVALADFRVGFKRISGTGEFRVTAAQMQWTLIEDGNVITIDEDRNQLFIQRGSHSTQINPPDMVEAQDVDHGSTITDSVPEWQGNGFVALGTADVVQKRTAVVAATSATYADVTSVEARRMAVGSDRLWIIDADADDGKAKFVVDDLTSANLSNAIQVIDPGTTVNGLFTHGEYTYVGHTRGFNSFTNSGKPSRLMESVLQFPAAANGARHATIWGWEYVATQLGLFALSIDPRIENPVGPGEGLEGQRFEGPIDGYPTAVSAFKDSLWVSYLNPDGDSYLLRGVFNQQITPGSGRPDWFIFRKLPSLTCEAIGATTGRTVPAVVWGEDADIAYADLSTRGREIEDSNYVFDTGGGQWFGTTLMMPIGVRGNVRWAKLFTENCVASTDTWQVAVDVDDASSYIDVGSAITANGAQTVRPVSGGVPLGTVAFTSLKPRLTQVAASETAPPQIRGELAIGVDARPEFVREVDVLLDLEKQSQLTDLQTLITDDTLSPVAIRFPTDQGVNEDKYGYVVSAEWYDRSDPNDNVALVKLREWEIS